MDDVERMLTVVDAAVAGDHLLDPEVGAVLAAEVRRLQEIEARAQHEASTPDYGPEARERVRSARRILGMED
jgi:hypothetical protein